jgi:hypothetical protein
VATSRSFEWEAGSRFQRSVVPAVLAPAADAASNSMREQDPPLCLNPTCRSEIVRHVAIAAEESPRARSAPMAPKALITPMTV